MIGDRTPAELVWCATSAPVIQGALIGLGAAAIGLAIFPFAVTLRRPSSGRMAGFARASSLMPVARAVSVALAILTAVATGGYVVIYALAEGRFCTARLDPRDQLIIVIWACTAIAALAVALLAGLLRWWTRRSADVD